MKHRLRKDLRKYRTSREFSSAAYYEMGRTELCHESQAAQSWYYGNSTCSATTEGLQAQESRSRVAASGVFCIQLDQERFSEARRTLQADKALACSQGR